MAIVRDANGRQVKTRVGLQPAQYQKQLTDAGLLDAVRHARGLERARLSRAASMLVHYLRTGEVSQRTKVCAAQLGLYHYPNPIEEK